MNNIRQKNVILGLKNSNNVPYGDIGHVNMYSGCENLTHAEINNAMRQLLDNDLFIENSLNNASSYVIGPKSSDNVADKPNGFKFYGELATSETLDILHKVDMPLSSTIMAGQTGNTAFATTWSDISFIGQTGRKLKYALDQTRLSATAEFPITANGFYQDDNRIIFAATDGVYELSSAIVDDETSPDYGHMAYSVVRLNKSAMTGVTAVHVDSKTQRIFASIGRNMYQAAYSTYASLESKAGKIVFESQNIADETSHIYAICSTNGSVIAGSDTGVLEQTESMVYGNSEQLTPENESPSSYTAVAAFDGHAFFGSSSGLYMADGSSLTRIGQDKLTSAITALATTSDSLYVACPYGVYKIDRSLNVSGNYLEKALYQNRIPEFIGDSQTANTVTAIAVNGERIFVGTDYGLYCLNSSGAVFINEICSDGSTRALPTVSGALRIIGVTSICLNGDSLLVGTQTGLIRLDISGVVQQQTNVVSGFRTYSDVKSCSLGNVKIVKILYNAGLADAYVVTSDSVYCISDLGSKWSLSNKGERITDACEARIGGRTLIVLVTNMGMYMLQPGTPPSKIAEPVQQISGDCVAATVQYIIIGRPDCHYYVRTDLDTVKTGKFVMREGGISKLVSYKDHAYGIQSGCVLKFDAETCPTLLEKYGGHLITGCEWSNAVSGYFTILDDKLQFSRISATYTQGECQDMELNVTVCDPVEFTLRKQDQTICLPTCMHVDDQHRKIYVGTDKTLFQADFSDLEITDECFVECAIEDGHEFGRIYSLCRGYTGESSAGAGDAYYCGQYSGLSAGGGRWRMDEEIVSENYSVVAACEDDIYQLKTCDSAGIFRSTGCGRFKAIASTKNMFAGIGRDDNKLRTCLISCESGQTAVPADRPTLIKTGTENDVVATFASNTVVSRLGSGFRIHDAVLPAETCWLRTFGKYSDQDIYVAGGANPILVNSIPNYLISEFQFDSSKTSYKQGVADIRYLIPPDERVSIPYIFEDRSAIDTYTVVDPETGEIQSVSREYLYTVNTGYDPLQYFTDTPEYSGHIMFSPAGVHIVDDANLVLSDSYVKNGSGSNVFSAKGFCVGMDDLFMVCGQDEGLQTVGNRITLSNFVVDRMEFADDHYYFKVDDSWKYSDSAYMKSQPTIQGLIEMDQIFQSAGLAQNEDIIIADGDEIYVGTSEHGLKTIDYFQNSHDMFSFEPVPAQLMSGLVESVNPVSGGASLYVVKRDDSLCRVYDFVPAAGLASVKTYSIRMVGSDTITSVSEFRKAVFADGNGSGQLYAVCGDGRLYIAKGNVFGDPPKYAGVDLTGIVYASAVNGRMHLACSSPAIAFAYNDVVFGHIWKNVGRIGKVNSILAIKDGKCLIATDRCLSYYRHESGYPGEVVTIREIPDGCSGLFSYSYDGKQKYLYASGSIMYMSDNYRLWKPLLSWTRTAGGASTGISRINTLYRLNGNVYMAAADAGFYYTRYMYEIVQDNAPFTKSDALDMYDRLMSSSISADIAATLSAHISAASGDHTSMSLISRVNRDFINVDLDNIGSDWQQSTLCNDVEGVLNVDVRNDLIDKMQFGSYSDGDVVVSVQNYLTDGAVVQTDISYIMKRWRSGVTELYINVPTTQTYYLANCYGASNCRHDQSDAYIRKNLAQFRSDLQAQDSILSTHYTQITVGIASASYSIDNMLDMQINGMSLPLGIYKDQTGTGDSGFAGKLYRSYIEPSVARTFDITSTDSDGNYIFKFACFGTDAQAIKLMFYDEKSRTGSSCVRLVFDSNGGEGVTPEQKFVIKPDQNGKTVLEQKTLRRCMFSNTQSGHQKFFAGWSVYPLADNSNATYQDKGAFPEYASGVSFESLMSELGQTGRTEQLKKNEQITLYAVWYDYQFSDSDTTMTMESDKSEFYIDSVGVDTSTRLKDKVIIDFGD